MISFFLTNLVTNPNFSIPVCSGKEHLDIPIISDPSFSELVDKQSCAMPNMPWAKDWHALLSEDSLAFDIMNAKSAKRGP